MAGSGHGISSSLRHCVVLVVAVFGPAVQYGFIPFDDDTYLLENPSIRRGLDGASLKWAFGFQAGYQYYPLTWLSHALDFSALRGRPGRAPRGQRRAPRPLHGAPVSLPLAAPLGAPGASALVAAALRRSPATGGVGRLGRRAEGRPVGRSSRSSFSSPTRRGPAQPDRRLTPGRSRPDLSRGSPRQADARDAPGRSSSSSTSGRSGGCRRERGGFEPRSGSSLEKLPFFVLSAAAAAVTILAQSAGGALASLETSPLAQRIAVALHAVAWYVGKTFLPEGLSIFYPLAMPGPWAVAIGAATLALFAGARAPPARSPRRTHGRDSGTSWRSPPCPASSASETSSSPTGTPTCLRSGSSPPSSSVSGAFFRSSGDPPWRRSRPAAHSWSPRSPSPRRPTPAGFATA